MIFGIKEKNDNFDPYNVLLAIPTNVPVRLKTGFVIQGHILERKCVWSLSPTANTALNGARWVFKCSTKTEKKKKKKSLPSSLWYPGQYKYR